MADGEWRADTSGPYAERFFLADGSATPFYRDSGTVVEVSEGGDSSGTVSSEIPGSPGSSTSDPPSVDPEEPADQTPSQSPLVSGGDGPVGIAGPPSGAPKTYRSRSVVIAVAVVIVLGGIAEAVIASRHSDANATSSGHSSNSGPASVRSLTGTLEVDYPTATYWSGAGGACTVPLAYGAETDGDQVVVASGSGNTLATGTLESGTVVDESASVPSGPGCSFSFTVTSVPNSAFYDVTIDGHHSPQYSLNQLQGEDWNVRLLLVS